MNQGETNGRPLAPPGGTAGAEEVGASGATVSSLDAGEAAGGISARRVGQVWRWGLRLAGGVALMALAAVIAIAISPLIPRPPAPTPPPLAAVTLQAPSGAGLAYSGAAWSPDGRSIALVRDSVGAANATSDSKDLTALIFDSQTGKLLGGFPLARMLMPASAPPNAQVEFGGVIWAPDGTRIAAPFAVLEDDVDGNLVPSAEGVALLTVRGAYPGEIATARDAPLSLLGPQQIAVWDTQPGAMERRLETVAPAYAYHWESNGALTPLNRVSQPGDVDLWSGGSLQYINALVCLSGGGGKFQPHPYLALTLATLAWSPGGRYLTGLNVTRRYEIPAGATPTPAAGEPLGACAPGPLYDTVPDALAPDAGLAAVETLAASPTNSSVALAWRPDHQRLAAFPFDINGAGAIFIYDCRTGALLKTITASQAPISGQPGTGPAKNFSAVFTGGVWSPDGRSLLVESSGSGATPFVLKPAALGG